MKLLSSSSVGALFVLSLLAACQHKDIPARAEVATEPARELLTGGTKVFSDDFERAAIGDQWQAEDPEVDWRIVDGWVHNRHAKNKGLWLKQPLPDNVRVEFDVRSEPRPGKRFEGDLKAEIFATRPEHQAGYILVNGGWNNSLDIIARLDEHGKDRRERASRPVEESRVYHWAIVRSGDVVYWFRDGQLFMTYEDADPIRGHYFGFNNWASHVYYDNLTVYRLD